MDEREGAAQRVSVAEVRALAGDGVTDAEPDTEPEARAKAEAVGVGELEEVATLREGESVLLDKPVGDLEAVDEGEASAFVGGVVGEEVTDFLAVGEAPCVLKAIEVPELLALADTAGRRRRGSCRIWRRTRRA